MLFVILKWISQILILASGFVGLFSKETYKIDSSTGKGSLTRLGWITVAALIIGFSLFVTTDIKERKDNSEKDRLQEQVVDGQKKQLLQLTNIILDRDLSGLELSFVPSEEHWRRIIDAYKKLPSPDNIYYPHSSLTAERAGNYWKLTFTPVLRPQGLRNLSTILTNQQGWEVFDHVLQAVLPSYFSIQWGTKLEVVVSGENSHPSSINLSRNKIAFVFRSPETRIVLNVLSSSDVTFKGWDYPNSIKLISLDPNVILDQTVTLNWKAVDDPNEDEHIQNPHFSGPHHLNIEFKNLSQ